MGQFIVDDGPLADPSGTAQTVMRMAAPTLNGDGQSRDKIDGLCDEITAYLQKHGGEFKTVRGLRDGLKAEGVKYTTSDVEPALLRLVNRGVLEWPEVEERKARPGALKGLLHLVSGALQPAQ
jgi:hypothetical protein